MSDTEEQPPTTTMDEEEPVELPRTSHQEDYVDTEQQHTTATSGEAESTETKVDQLVSELEKGVKLDDNNEETEHHEEPAASKKGKGKKGKNKNNKKEEEPAPEPEPEPEPAVPEPEPQPEPALPEPELTPVEVVEEEPKQPEPEPVKEAEEVLPEEPTTPPVEEQPTPVVEEEKVVEEKPAPPAPTPVEPPKAAAPVMPPTAPTRSNTTPEKKPQHAKQPQVDIVYNVKWIEFGAEQVPIVMQNENGPCPLIAISNVLLLKKLIALKPHAEFINGAELLQLVGDCLFAKFAGGKTDANMDKNVDDILQVLPNMQYGLDVNVKFNGGFEYTPEMNVFDVFNINLLHGWLVDPQEKEVVAAMGSSASYNQVTNMILQSKSGSQSGELAAKALTAETFLQQTRSQLTNFGLFELQAALKPAELAVFFRNNHFSVIYKNAKDSQMYLLVTDSGYLNEPRIVWELLNNIEGDSEFYDGKFVWFKQTGKNGSSSSSASSSQQNPDYLLAMSMQREQQKPLEKLDEQYAKKLQEEERKLAMQQQQQQPSPARQAAPQPHHHQQHTASPGEKKEKKGGCVMM